MSTIIYRIQNPITGLFSTGTANPRWTKTGKVWVSRSALSNHFNILGAERALAKYEGCVIIDYELTETEVNRHSARDNIIGWYQRSFETAAKEKVRIQKRIVEQKQAALAKAQRELEQITNKGK